MAGIDILASAFSGANAAFLADLYARWASDPASVDPSFADLFDAMNDEARAVLEDATRASWSPRPSFSDSEPTAKPAPQSGPAPEHTRAAIVTSLRALMLIRSYRVRGHLEARLDPLGITVPAKHTELDPATYGFTEADMDKPIFIDNVL